MTRPDVPPQRVARRDLDLPPGIVWTALVDPDLLAGWLGEVSIEDDLRFVLRRSGGAEVRGRIVELVEAERLELETDLGTVQLSLMERSGGLRGTWTALSVTAPTSVATPERWESALERLEELLHGRPSDGEQARSDAMRRAH